MSTLPRPQNLTQGSQKRIQEALGAARLTLGQRVLIDKALALAYLTGLSTGAEAVRSAEREDPREKIGHGPTVAYSDGGVDPSQGTGQPGGAV